MGSSVGPQEEWVQRVGLEVFKDTSILYEGVIIDVLVAILHIEPRLQPGTCDVVGHGVEIKSDEPSLVRHQVLLLGRVFDLDKRCSDIKVGL